MAFGQDSSIICTGQFVREARPRSWGQNFLTNHRIAYQIAASVPDEALPYLVEIGPGRGILTQKLIERGGNVLAIELDGLLIQYLDDLFKAMGERFKVVHGDAVKLLDLIIKDRKYLVSNLPFSISSELFYGILESLKFDELKSTGFMGGVVMVQEEFAKRLLAPPGGKGYGRLSVCFQSKMEGRSLFRVKSGNFDPVPEVDAQVIRFSPRREGFEPPKDEALFDRLIGAAFSARRKKLRNSIHPGSLRADLRLDDIRSVLGELGLQDKRPEQLSVRDFIGLSNGLSESP